MIVETRLKAILGDIIKVLLTKYSTTILAQLTMQQLILNHLKNRHTWVSIWRIVTLDFKLKQRIIYTYWITSRIITPSQSGVTILQVIPDSLSKHYKPSKHASRFVLHAWNALYGVITLTVAISTDFRNLKSSYDNFFKNCKALQHQFT